MRKWRSYPLFIFATLCLGGCRRPETPAVPTGSAAQSQPVVQDQAVSFYDSLEEFRKVSQESVFVLSENSSAVSGAPEASFSFDLTEIAERDSYISISYECAVDGNPFPVSLLTYKSEEVKTDIARIFDGKPGMDINGIKVHYWPGGEREHDSTFAMELQDRIVLLSIKKGFGDHAPIIMDHLNLDPISIE